MRTVECRAEPAALLSIKESTLQYYLQTYPCLQGPDHALNEKILTDLPGYTRMRNPAAGCQVERLDEQEAVLAPKVEKRAREIFAAIGMPQDRIEHNVNLMSWKMRDVAPDTRSILDIGCGAGVELTFLRAKAPDAHIVAVDWMADLSPELIRIANIDFRKVDVFDYLEKTSESFDLVFSHHVFEHLYEPERILNVLKQRVAPGGKMIAVLPLEGQGIFFPSTLSQLKGEGPKCWAYFGAVDLAHAWKTTPSDLKQTLGEAGFTTVRLVQRDNHLSTVVPYGDAEMDRFRRRGWALRKMFIGPFYALAKLVFGHDAPYQVKRVFFALERRVWFGGNRFKNAQLSEIAAIAG